MNRAQTREWRRRQGSEVYTPEAYYDPDAPAQHEIADQAFVLPKKAPLRKLSHSDARHKFANFLVAGGMPREKADKTALDTSARVCRKQGFKL